jgi:hypothetical protein
MGSGDNGELEGVHAKTLVVYHRLTLHAAEQQHGDLELNSVGNGGPAAGLRKMRGEIKVWRPGSTVAPHELTCAQPWQLLGSLCACA